jgi:hypothetical protein
MNGPSYIAPDPLAGLPRTFELPTMNGGCCVQDRMYSVLKITPHSASPILSGICPAWNLLGSSGKKGI